MGSRCDYLENVLEFEPQKDQSDVITNVSRLQDLVDESGNHNITVGLPRPCYATNYIICETFEKGIAIV
jgi:hypothetical protein